MILPATMLTRISSNYANKTAFHCGETSRTWSDMHDRAGRLASGLSSLGVTKGDSVVILGKDSVEVFEHYFACMVSGFVRVSINWRYAAAELAHILKDCDAKTPSTFPGKAARANWSDTRKAMGLSWTMTR